MTYRKINNFLVQKGLITNGHIDKDFTYVQWNSMNPTSAHWWDEKRARKPSWLDHILTFILLTLPFLLGVLIYEVTKNAS